jgi:hypothetical protein
LATLARIYNEFFAFAVPLFQQNIEEHLHRFVDRLDGDLRD